MHPQSTRAPETEQEEWRPVVGYEGWHEVSSLGRVRRVRAGAGTRAGRVLVYSRGRGNYPAVCLCAERRQRTAYVHRLVCAAFLGPCPPGKEVNHRDRNRWNARLDNLEYVTHGENMRHAFRNGGEPARGSRTGAAKLTEADVAAIRASTEPQRVLAKRFGVTQGVISVAKRGLTWRHVR